MVTSQATIKGVVEPEEAACDKITKKIKRSAKVLSHLPAATSSLTGGLAGRVREEEYSKLKSEHDSTVLEKCQLETEKRTVYDVSSGQQ
ncbi:hypothetical protein L6452_08475 [Arctium lappa]|uniref:Uncharacterized protein n=1 Tax=Arctium lappa TaxID=4217 RepID=A0ACB9DHT9_ARCLA|nr:hypothetical protein L6452_08475 [Arctium lappa]